MSITALHGVGLAGGLVAGGLIGHGWQQHREEAAAPRVAENARAMERSKPWVDSYNAFRETLVDESYAEAASKTADYVAANPIPEDASITISAAGSATVDQKGLFRSGGKEGYTLDPSAPLGNDTGGPFLAAGLGGVLGGMGFAATLGGGGHRAAVLGVSLLFGTGVGIAAAALRANIPGTGV